MASRGQQQGARQAALPPPSETGGASLGFRQGSTAVQRTGGGMLVFVT